MSRLPLALPAPATGWPAAAGRRLVRGREEDPWWSRPGLIAASALSGLLVCWRLTLNGYANPYYAEAALAASRSWTALLTNAADLSGSVSLDKGPLSDWLMGLSGRVFGFGSLSMLLPSAVCGVATVVVLHDLVRRTLGHRPALLAALMLAVSPVSVVMARYNNPDALLALLLVASAWALVRALETSRVRELVLCGGLVGLAFNTKMLEGYLIVPGLAVAFLLAARGGRRRRLGALTAGAAAMIAVSFAWYGTMMLIPAADRPYVGDSTGNSWFDLIFGANGLSRVSGGGFGGGFGGATGPLRLFGPEAGGQIAWLLPLALLGLVAGLRLSGRAPRTDRRRAALVLLGLWTLAGYLVFSFSQGIFHAYYTSAIAPAVAGLAAAAVVDLTDRARAGAAAARLLLAAAVAGTAVLSFALLARTPSFAPALRWAVLAGGALAAAGVLLGPHLPRRARVAVVGTAGAVGLLAGPAGYALATIGHGQTGSIPAAGPLTAGVPLGPGGLALLGRRPPPGSLGLGLGFFGVPGRRAFAGGDAADPALVRFLVAHRGRARYLVAATGSMAAAPIGLASRAPVITLGGFMGADPAPTVAQLRSFVRSGQVRFVLLGGFGPGGLVPGGLVGAAGGALGTAAGGVALFGPAPPGLPRFAALARDQWVRAHCRAVSVPASAESGLFACAPQE
jgi:4-amino-4-deoxy-L-arabinose transferase-like glycosyltransferase